MHRSLGLGETVAGNGQLALAEVPAFALIAVVAGPWLNAPEC